MENFKKKCSLKEHKEIDAIYFCQECKIYICNKCDQFHSNWYKEHHKFNLNKDLMDIFTGFCQEKNHSVELRYFCKTHNKLCCAECITKIKDNENGQHSDCDICIIQDIEKIKKNKLSENIIYLQNLSQSINESLSEFKIIFEKINENKEELNLKIQKIFTKLRNILNDREDELLKEIDNYFNNSFFSENLIKEGEKLPQKIKISLEEGKLIEKEWGNKPLNSSINDCLIIEKNINDSIKIEKNVKKYNSFNYKVNLILQEKDIENFSEEIKKIVSFQKNLFDSLINFDQSLVKTWLNNKNFISELLFRKTRDGSTPDDFHNKCDNKGKTIIFIETTKGYKFGGYTEMNWDTSNSSKVHDSIFIFSFDNRKKYIAKKIGAICGNKNYGPWFGNNYPEIVFNSTLDKGRSWDNQIQNIFVSGKELTKGEEFWEVKELEVFKIEYV